MTLKKYFYYFTSIFTLLLGVKPIWRVISLFLKRKSDRPALIELRQSKLRFWVRSAMDMWSIKETLLDRFYERCGFAVEDGWSIIDIGGGIGDFTLLAACQSPSNTVFVFEPTPSSVDLLKENLELNGVTNVQIFPAAVWSHDEEIVIDTEVGADVQNTSQAIGALEQSVRPGKVVVPGISLASVFEVTGLSACDLVKLDCEGAEYAILYHTPDALLERIQRIVMEYHENTGQGTHSEMADFLTGKGFTVKVYPNVVHSYIGYLSAVRNAS